MNGDSEGTNGAGGDNRRPDAAEVDRITRLADEWTRIGLSTDRCDRPAAEAAVRAVYAACGVPAPDIVLWADSPLGGVSARSTLHDVLTDSQWAAMAGRFSYSRDDRLSGSELFAARGRRAPRVDDRWWAGRDGPDPAGWLPPPLRDRLAFGLCGRIHTRIGQQLAEHLRGTWPQVWARLGTALRDRISAGLGAGLDALPWERLADHREAPSSAAAPRTWDNRPPRELRPAELLPWYVDPMSEVTDALKYQLAVDAPLPGPLATWVAAVPQLGIWWPMRDAAVLTDRPTAVHHDGRGELHRADGPAVTYADGYAQHSWHGVAVPADLVTGDGWAPDRILREANAEVRRCAIEKRGWDRFVHEAELTPVGGQQPDPGNPGQLLRLYDLPPQLREMAGGPARILVVSNASPDRDGTRRSFGLPVPVDCPDPLTAAALTFDIPAAEYAALDRAT